MSLKLNHRWERYKGGGGGAAGAGKIEYPPYQVNMHSLALYGFDLAGPDHPNVYGSEPHDGSLFELIGSRIGMSFATDIAISAPTDLVAEGTPYQLIVGNINPTAQLSIPDPSTYLSGVDTKFTDLDSAISDLSDDTALDNAQDSFEQETENTYLRGLNRFAAQMADINAVNSSAFILGTAMMESSRQRSIADFRSKMDLSDRYAAIQAKQDRVKLELEYQKTRLVAEIDRINMHTEMAVQSELYHLELWEYAQNMLGATSGAVSSKSKSGNKLQSALSGALTGAGLAAAYGAMTAPAGATGLAAVGGATTLGIGAGIGILAGLLFD